jgi:predicted HicB family RNase H-like nuclease
MSDFFEYKGYNGTIEYSAADKILHGKVLGIRSLLSYEGNSLDSLRSDFEDVINDYLETCAEDGMEPEKPYKGSFNVRVSPELHRSLALYSSSRGQTLNATVEDAIKQLVTAH